MTKFVVHTLRKILSKFQLRAMQQKWVLERFVWDTRFLGHAIKWSKNRFCYTRFLGHSTQIGQKRRLLISIAMDIIFNFRGKTVYIYGFSYIRIFSKIVYIYTVFVYIRSIFKPYIYIYAYIYDGYF